MTQIQKNFTNYGALLGGDNLEAASGNLFNARTLLNVNTRQRTIIIGMGGAGLSTINYIKRMLIERMNPNWNKYIAFLAIDSDRNQFDKMKYVNDPKELVSTTRAKADERMLNPNLHPEAVRRIMNPPLQDPQLKWFGNGSGQRRLMGRAKLHDKESGGNGVDQEIVEKLKSIQGNFASMQNDDEFTVYIIGSLCGGTAAGGIQDIPALVRHALTNTVGANLKVHGMLFVPDAMVATLPDKAAKKAMANGYAALKEINYYQGMGSRLGYTEKFPFNDPATPVIELTKYFDSPILVGNAMGAIPNADVIAQQTVAEYLMNMLAQNTPSDQGGMTGGMTLQSVLHNDNATYLYAPGTGEQEELVGEAHEFPYAFGAIGFARASAPKKIIMAYAVDKVCKLSGLQEADLVEENANGAAVRQGLVPFQGNLFNATLGTQQALQLVAPFSELLNVIHNGQFNFAHDVNGDAPAEWKMIRQGSYDSTKNTALRKVDSITGIPALNALKNSISGMYQNYLAGVSAFVKQYGPLAYVNIYQGNFIKQGDNHGIGVKAMLDNMMRGYGPKGQIYERYMTTTETIENLNNSERVVRNESALALPNKRASQASNWQARYNDWVNSEINTKRREVAIGQNKYIDDCICKPAEMFAEQMEKFGHLLNELAKIYAGFGAKVQNFEEFSKAKDGECEINLAAQQIQTYQWLKNQVDQQLVGVNLRGFRDSLIDSFIADPEGWLDDAEATINNSAQLKTSAKPIAARGKFDSMISEQLTEFVLNVSIQDIFANLQAQGSNFQATAQQVMDSLRAQSKVQFNGDTKSGYPAKIVLIPSALQQNGGTGPQIYNALIAQLQQGELCVESDDAEGISMYNCINSLPIYRLANLRSWEQNYLLGVTSEHYNEGLHGLSPAARPETIGKVTSYNDDHMPWRDYPTVTVEENPQERDNEGWISREGKIRNDMDAVLKAAEKWGIIQYSKDAKGDWTCSRIYLAKSKNWELKFNACPTDEQGYIVTGQALMDEIFSQNGVSTEQERKRFVKEIKLATSAPLMAGKYATEELARTYIPRILRAHVPMYLEIKETLAKFEGAEGWGAIIEAINEEERRRRILERFPGLFIRFIQAGIIKKDVKSVWSLLPAQGKNVSLLNESFNRFLRGKEKALATTYKAYYLYKILRSKYDDDAYMKLGNYAEEEIGNLIAAGDMDTLDENTSVAAMLMEAANELEAQGAILGDLEAPLTSKFRKYMEEYAVDEDEIMDLLNFYAVACAELAG